MNNLVGVWIAPLALVGVISASVGSAIVMTDMVSFGAGPNSAGAASRSLGSPAAETPTRILIDLPPIVTNLADPSDTWVRVEGSIVLDAARVRTVNVLAATVADDILAYMRTLGLSQIAGASGLIYFRNEITARAMTRGGAGMVGVVLKTLVVQ